MNKIFTQIIFKLQVYFPKKINNNLRTYAVYNYQMKKNIMIFEFVQRVYLRLLIRHAWGTKERCNRYFGRFHVSLNTLTGNGGPKQRPMETRLSKLIP